MNEHRSKVVTVLILLALLAGCARTPTTPAPSAYWPTAGWQSAAPEEQGMDSEKLALMVEHIQGSKLPLHSLLVVRGGYLVTELYVYPYSAGQVHAVASVTKSVVSSLVGIAIQKGLIKDTQQPLANLLPEGYGMKLDEAKKAITLEHLLTMTSGLDCSDNTAPGEPFMQASPDWVQFLLDLPMAARPGMEFNYCTAAVELLSAILQHASGMSAREFANQNLFAPLGIPALTEARWPSDPQGVTVGGYGLSLAPREMAKLGYLFLRQGMWDGKEVLPAAWVAASTASHANQGDKKEYGYLWWLDPQGKWYAALGRAGQHIFIYPAESLMVVFTSDLPLGSDADLLPLQELLDQYILPAVKSTSPLPANDAGLARLQAGIQALAQPQTSASQPLPAIALEISGKTYTLEDNLFGWHTLTFSFQEGASEASITIDGAQVVPIGLDNGYRTQPGGDSAFPQVLRGRWEGENTLVVDQLILGQEAHYTHRIQFSGAALTISDQEKYSGMTVELHGVQNP